MLLIDSQPGLPRTLKVRRSPSASAAVGRNVYAWPTVALVAGEPEIVGARLVCATVTVNAGRLVVAVPSLTLITIPVAVPTFAAAGVPVSVPSLLLIDNHDGLPRTLNVRRSPSASAAVGRNVYAWPTVAPVEGEPEIVGARLVCATVTVNAGRLVVAVPSLTLITMPDVAAPTFAAAGVPVSVPSLLLIDNQPGLPWTLKVRRSPSASAAVGRNTYAWSTVAPVAGEPEIVGAWFTGSGVVVGGGIVPGATTVMSNAGRCVWCLPSVTRTWMFRYLPTLFGPGMPVSVPVDLLKLAQPGRLLTRNLMRLPSGSIAIGRNEYILPTSTTVGAVPAMIGGLLLSVLALPACAGAAAAPASNATRAIRAETRRGVERCEIKRLCMTRHSPGNPAIRDYCGPEALRPRLATGLLLNELAVQVCALALERATVAARCTSRI